ncbi:MAG: sigma-70 family RNA polymerase sigma factor [Planctomycetota bacterium]
MALFLRHQPAIQSFVMSLLGSHDDSEVVMQETSVKLWKKFDQFERGSSFRNWAFQIARYEALNHRRRKQRDRHLFTEELMNQLASDAEQQSLVLEEERRILSHCIAKLSEGDRGVLAACYREGATIKQYAQQVGRTANAVGKQLAKIRAALLRCVRTTLAGEAP